MKSKNRDILNLVRIISEQKEDYEDVLSASRKRNYETWKESVSLQEELDKIKPSDDTVVKNENVRLKGKVQELSIMLLNRGVTQEEIDEA